MLVLIWLRIKELAGIEAQIYIIEHFQQGWSPCHTVCFARYLVRAAVVRSADPVSTSRTYVTILFASANDSLPGRTYIRTAHGLWLPEVPNHATPYKISFQARGFRSALLPYIYEPTLISLTQPLKASYLDKQRQKQCLEPSETSWDAAGNARSRPGGRVIDGNAQLSSLYTWSHLLNAPRCLSTFLVVSVVSALLCVCGYHLYFRKSNNYESYRNSLCCCTMRDNSKRTVHHRWIGGEQPFMRNVQQDVRGC